MEKNERRSSKVIVSKFTSELARDILSGKKRTTWRVDDDKDIKVGDVLLLYVRKKMPDGRSIVEDKPFGKAKVKNIIFKTFNELTDEDLYEHEYLNKEAALLAFQGFYSDKINESTKLKIIEFERQTENNFFKFAKLANFRRRLSRF